MWSVFLLALVLPTQASCPEPVPVLLEQGRQPLTGDHLLVLADPEARETAESLRAGGRCDEFAARTPDRVPVRATPGFTWYRFRLATVGTRPSDWALEVPARGLPTVCVDWPVRRGRQTQCADAGSADHGAQYLFPVPAGFNDQKPVLMRVDGALIEPWPLAVVTPASHQAAAHRHMVAAGAFFGLVAAMVVLAGVAFLIQRRRDYLYFAGFYLAAALSGAGFAGYGLEMLGAQSARLAAAAPPATAAIALVLLVMFVRGNLELREVRNSLPNLLCLAAIALDLVVVPLAAGRPPVAVAALPWAAGITLSLVLCITGWRAWRGSWAARYLLLALVPFAVGIFGSSAGVLFDRVAPIASFAGVGVAGYLLLPLVLLLGAYRRYRATLVQRDEARGALLAEQRLALLRSSYCRLTGLPRRGRITELFARLTRASSPERIRIGLYLLHIDNLGEIRLRHGRGVLEQVVCTLANRLRDGLEDDQLLGRLEDWELVAVIPTTLRDDDFRTALLKAAERIVGCIQDPMTIANRKLELSLSVGLSVWPLHGYSFDELVKRCDSALYEAQAAGGNRIKIFTEEDHQARSHQFRKVHDLRAAAEADQLQLFYQPVHDARSGVLTGLEALIRWRHPDLGLVMPDEFIGLAEEFELIQELGLWVLDESMKDLAWLGRNGFDDLSVALNVSPRQFNHPGFAAGVGDRLRHSDIDPGRLRLEITEDCLIDNMEQTREALEFLRSLGVMVYVDDFGVGYSSLNYIRSLPIQGLKIDKSFVMNIGRTTQDEAVVGTIVGLARNLHLDLVAEGVETDYQRQYLMALGCLHLQGHLFSEPMPKGVLLEYLDAHVEATG